MTRQKYIMGFFACAIILIILLVGYGIYVNYVSRDHVAKMSSAQYFRVGGAKTAYREINPVIHLPPINLYSVKMADVHFQINGTMSNIFVKPGDRVQKDQLLGEITNSEIITEVLQAQGKITAAEAALVKHESTKNRYLAIENVNAVSRQQIDEAVGNAKAAAGDLVSAQAYHDQLVERLAYQKITAPFDGHVLQIYHAPGSVVRTGDSLLLIGELSLLYFQGRISDTDFEQMKPYETGLKLVTRRSAFSPADVSGHGSEFSIRVVDVMPPPAVRSPYRTVVYQLDNAAGFLEPGTCYQAKIVGAEKRRVLSIPKEALSGDDRKSVFVINDQGRLEKKLIQVGIYNDEFVEVLSGLSADETVVITGKEDELTAGMKVRLVESATSSQ